MKLILLITALSLALVLTIYRKARKDAERIFNSDYENLVRLIRKPPTEERYDTIKKKIHRLKKTPGMEREKMDVVEAEFLRAYTKEKKC